MKLNGRKLTGPKPKIEVIPREDGDLVFKLQATVPDERVTRLVPEPAVPWIAKPGQKEVSDFKDPTYLAQREAAAKKRSDYMILQSLSATEGLEWETVDLENPETWHNWVDELKTFLTDPEIVRIQRAVMSAHGIDEEKYKEARERFLHGQAAV